MSVARTVADTAGRIVLPIGIFCFSAFLYAALVAHYGWNPSTDALILIEFVFVLYVAPRVTRRQVNRSLPDLVAAHVTPALGKELAHLWLNLDRRLIDTEARLHPDLSKMPAKEEVAQAVAAALPPLPTTEGISTAVLKALAAMQQEGAAKAGAQRDAMLDAFAARMRAEMEDVVAGIDFGAPAPEDAARALGNKGVQARYDIARNEEQFRASVQHAMGPTALVLLDEWAGAYPQSYKAYSRQGVKGAQALAQDPTVQALAKKFNLTLPAAPGAQGGAHPSGNPFLPPGARLV